MPPPKKKTGAILGKYLPQEPKQIPECVSECVSVSASARDRQRTFEGSTVVGAAAAAAETRHTEADRVGQEMAWCRLQNKGTKPVAT